MNREDCKQLITKLQDDQNDGRLLDQLQELSNEIVTKRKERIETLNRISDYVCEFNIKNNKDGISMSIYRLLGLNNDENIYEKFVCEEFGHDYYYVGCRETETDCDYEYRCRLCGHTVYNRIEKDTLLSISDSAKKVLTRKRKK